MNNFKHVGNFEYSYVIITQIPPISFISHYNDYHMNDVEVNEDISRISVLFYFVLNESVFKFYNAFKQFSKTIFKSFTHIISCNLRISLFFTILSFHPFYSLLLVTAAAAATKSRQSCPALATP